MVINLRFFARREDLGNENWRLDTIEKQKDGRKWTQTDANENFKMTAFVNE
jgi:hypothetical protein